MKKRYTFKSWVVFPIFWGLMVALDFASFRFDSFSPIGLVWPQYREFQYWTFDRRSWRAAGKIRGGVADGPLLLRDLFGPDAALVCAVEPYGDISEVLAWKGVAEADTTGLIPTSVSESNWSLVVFYSGGRDADVLTFVREQIDLEFDWSDPWPDYYCFDVSSGVGLERNSTSQAAYFDLEVRFTDSPLP